MTAGCISKNFDIPNYIYNSKEKQLGKSEFYNLKSCTQVAKLAYSYYITNLYAIPVII